MTKDRAASEPAPEDLTEFEELDPYSVLQVARDASEAAVRQAYRKQALRTHPDKVAAGASSNTHTFAQVAWAYAILGDKQRRKLYDTTGATSASDLLSGDDDFDWKDFFHTCYENAVSGRAVEEFRRAYQGSEEERDDLLAAYKAHSGDMDSVFASVMCSDEQVDMPRFCKIIDEAISAGEVEAYRAYARTARGPEAHRKRRKRAEREAREAEELRHEMGLDEQLNQVARNGDDEAALGALLRAKGKARMDDLVSRLEAKYAKPKKAKR